MAFNPLEGFSNPWAAGGNSAALNTPATSFKPSAAALQTPIFDNDREVLDNTFNALDIKIIHGKSTILNGGEVFISELPEMPKLILRVTSERYKKISCKIRILFERQYITSGGLTITRKIEKLMPEVGKVWSITTNQDVTNIFDWGEKIYGGKALIEFFESVSGDNLIATFTFSIKGLNPSVDVIKQYLLNKGYNWWFFKGILKQETDLNHFAPKTVTLNYLGTRFTLYKGEPYFGPPDGYGLAQIDRKDEYKESKGPVDLDYIWNWKKNIDEAAKEVNAKIQSTKRHLLNQIKKIKKDWEADKSNVVAAADLVQGNITFKHAPFSYPGFEEINKYFDDSIVTDDIVKSFIEANIIRNYNGGNFYYVEYDSEMKKWYWKVDKVSKESGSYVANVCSKLTWILIFLVLIFQSTYANKYPKNIRLEEDKNEQVVSEKTDTNSIINKLKLNKDDSIVLFKSLLMNDDKIEDYIVITAKKINRLGIYAKGLKIDSPNHTIHFILYRKGSYQVYCSNNSLLKDFETEGNNYLNGLYPSVFKIKNKIILSFNGEIKYREIKIVFSFKKESNKIIIKDIITFFDKYKYYNGEHSIIKIKNIDMCSATYLIYDKNYHKVWGY